MQKKTIAIDIDDVLAMSAQGFAQYSNERWGTGMSAENYSEEWAVAWGVSIEEAVRRSKELHASGVVGRYDPFLEAGSVLRRLAKTYDLVIVTSRQSVLKPETESWLDKHFTDIFSAVHYVGIWDDWAIHDAAHRAKMTKADICRQLGADYLVDDQVKHCIAAAEAGVQSLLFGYYGWNRQLAEMPDNMVRVRDWKEVGEFFDAQQG